MKGKGMMEQSQVTFKLSMIDDMLRIRNAAKSYIPSFETKTISPYTKTIFIIMKIYNWGDRVQDLKQNTTWPRPEADGTEHQKPTKQATPLTMKHALSQEWDSNFDPLGFISPKEQTVG